MSPARLTVVAAAAVHTLAGAVRAEPAPSAITVAGYVEAYYQLHLQAPSNRITNLRGFDDRSRTFTLSNAALDVKGERGRVSARVVLQVGSTPSTYYLAEPVAPGTSSVNPSGPARWEHLQTAMIALAAPRAITVEAGLFPSPIGIEVIPVKDNWNWSRSNLFFGLPFYHTGVHVLRPLGGGWTGKLHVYNGWNSVVDNNATPSVGVSLGYASATTTAQLLYLGGVERATGAPEGRPVRHLFDALVQRALTDDVSVMAQADAGVEPQARGTSAWLAGALYGKLALSPRLYAAVRGDYFRERVADGAGAIFWPVRWVGSGTLTVAYLPADGASVRLEYRHDHAAGPAYFGGAVTGDGVTQPFEPNRSMQDTATLGVTAWF